MSDPTVDQARAWLETLVGVQDEAAVILKWIDDLTEQVRDWQHEAETFTWHYLRVSAERDALRAREDAQ